MGRPATVKNGLAIQIWLGAAEHDWLVREATKNSVTISAMIRAVVNDAIAEEKNVQRSASAGRAGSGEATTTDGATTP